MSAVKNVTLSEFCATGSGGTPSRSKLERYYEGGTIPWVKSGELRESIINCAEEHVTDAALKESSIKLVPAGAILLAMYGATVGRLGILGIEATTNQAVCHIVPDPKVALTRYVYHALSSKVPNLISMGVGGAQPNINQGIIKNLAIPLPPLPEQRRIAAILDQADALRAKRREALSQLDSLTHSIFIEMFGDPATNPMSWPVKAIEQLCEVKGGKRLPKGADYSASPTPFRYVRVTNLSGGRVDESNLLYLTPEVQRTIARYIVNTGDVIISIAGSIGLIAAVPKSLNGANLTENAAKLVARTKNIYLPDFLAFMLRMKAIQSQIDSHVGQVTIGKLALFRIEKLLIPLPPLSLQQIFATRIKFVESLKATQRDALSELEALFASLQHRAFQGEL